jgi:hypothetical protein
LETNILNKISSATNSLLKNINTFQASYFTNSKDLNEKF